MKNSIALFLIVSSFCLMNLATKKVIYYPCESQIYNYLAKDTSDRSYYWMSTHDTILIKAQKDTLWSQKTDTICRILRDSCQVRNYKILVVDTSYFNQTGWNTPYGKKYFFRQCQ